MEQPTPTIACKTFPGVMSLNVVGPLQLCGSTNAERAGHGLPPTYLLQLLTQAPEPVMTSAGFALLPDSAWNAQEPA